MWKFGNKDVSLGKIKKDIAKSDRSRESREIQEKEVSSYVMSAYGMAFELDTDDEYAVKNRVGIAADFVNKIGSVIGQDLSKLSKDEKNFYLIARYEIERRARLHHIDLPKEYRFIPEKFKEKVVKIVFQAKKKSITNKLIRLKACEEKTKGIADEKLAVPILKDIKDLLVDIQDIDEEYRIEEIIPPDQQYEMDSARLEFELKLAPYEFKKIGRYEHMSIERRAEVVLWQNEHLNENESSRHIYKKLVRLPGDNLVRLLSHPEEIGDPAYLVSLTRRQYEEAKKNRDRLRKHGYWTEADDQSLEQAFRQLDKLENKYPPDSIKKKNREVGM